MSTQKPPNSSTHTTSKPTQKTIAEITGLAVTTVSRALQGDEKIAQATRLRVSKVAEEIGYVPDRAAQRLRTGKTKVISLILDPHNEILGFGNSLITGVAHALAGTDYHLNVTPQFLGGDPIEPVEYIVRNKLADGIIFSRTRPFDERVRFLRERSFPFTTHGRTEFGYQHSYVDYDNEKFAYESVLRLMQKGRRRICVILPPNHFTFHQHLNYGYMRAIRQEGLQCYIPEGINLDSDMPEIFEWAQTIAGTSDAPDGFICPGETSFLAIANGYRQAGKERGRDFDAVVKSSSQTLHQIDSQIDNISEDIRQAGALLGANLLKTMLHPDGPFEQTIQDPDITFPALKSYQD
ncbi:HTH-type transcriptional regulator RafR [Pseudovibrio sp. W64]|uniref:LacI family transcriptional regulator n=1 Tax=unclassified Pseudovibrio TaxID=2627060 RepID=UPI0007AE681C|nr:MULTISPECIES: LacI family transcriptional regulator [unclassified Pseudovibrio]KZK78607.1 HTH-type transcriptional regulator RafR [Pseudovibrio sp. W64]KZK82757.1 HTH-type transcriptional regulator RafR [Pseudovibrio sp. Ad13]KZK85527.1 HTH-type transcriptional regulator RafR [Pseudovibrio sp. Ad46]